MRLTDRQLNRATLGRQLLLARAPVDAVEAVRRVVAVQGQHAASPYLALWNRVDRFDPADLDAALADHRLVKATLMRITLHVVHADDHRVMHRAMQPTLRGSRLGDPRFTRSGLSAADADALVPDLVAHAAVPRTVAELEAWLAARVLGDPKGVWWALRSFAPLVHAPTGGPWSFGLRPSYVAATTPSSPEATGTPDGALPALVRRYLEGFGPASVADVAQFALVQRTRARDALGALADTLEQHEGPAGTTLYDVPGAPLAPEETAAPPRLLPMWDSVLLAYADRSRVVPPQYRRLVTRTNGDVLPTLLVDGHVAGVWRPVDDGIEATAFEPLPDDAWEGLAAEARSLLSLLADREPRVYSRYGRWWASLPDDDVRVLGRD